MTGTMNQNSEHISQMELLMMKKIDGEITPQEEIELQQYLADFPERRKELTELQHVKEETEKMKKQILPEMAWDEYWAKIYNRLERGISWILISAGAMIVLGYALLEMVNALLGDSQMPLPLKFGIIALLLGGVILLISVIREKLMVRKHDKYKEIQR
jgi:anti-sigma factor RsiW